MPSSEKLLLPGTQFKDEIVPQGYFNIVLEAFKTMSGAHAFKVNGNGICKTPYGMFDEETIPNDMSIVLARLEEMKNGIDCPEPKMFKSVKEHEDYIKSLKAKK
jgi:hypothetical protein